MNIRFWPRSVRVRLTLGYVTALAIVLAVYAVSALSFLRHNLYTALDGALHDDFEAAEARFERGPDGNIREAASGHHHTSDDASADYWTHERPVEVWSLDGRRLYPHDARSVELPLPDTFGGVVVASILVDATSWRVRAAPYPIDGEPVWIRVARSESRLHHELHEFVVGMLLGLPLAMVLAGVAGYWLAGRALAPVARMAQQAATITADRLGERLPTANPHDEFGRLGAVFNDTLARLEQSFDELRRFTADASHELRTPLTAIRSVGEVGLREAADEDWRDVVGSMLEEVDRLTSLVDALLALARSDGGSTRLEPLAFDVGDLCRDVAEHLGVLAEERGQTIQLDTTDEPVEVVADRLLLRQALINLVDNAIKYGPPDSTIRIQVEADDDATCITVVDEGPGIPVEHASRVFDRFYRVDKARARETGGAGLGLSIAQRAVEIQGGTIGLDSTPGVGSRFTIDLPRGTDDVRVDRT